MMPPDDALLRPPLAAVRDVPERDLVAPARGAGATTNSWSGAGDDERIARRAIDIGRRTALGVLAGDRATADDVAKEVAIGALRHARRLRDPRALDGWLYRVAVRKALRALRRGGRRREAEHRHAARGPAWAEDDPALDELGCLLAGLPDRQRAALTLRYAHDLDDERIAAALGCRVGTVRALLSRGRAAVRARLTPNDSDDPGASDA